VSARRRRTARPVASSPFSQQCAERPLGSITRAGAELVFRSKAGKRLSQPTLTACWAQVRAPAGLEHDFYLATKHLRVHLLYKLGLSKRAIAAQIGWGEKNVEELLRIYGHADLVALAEVDALYSDVAREEVEANG
jgi:hypothetical protein